MKILNFFMPGGLQRGDVLNSWFLLLLLLLFSGVWQIVAVQEMLPSASLAFPRFQASSINFNI